MKDKMRMQMRKIFLLAFSFFLFSGCGLDVYYILYPPSDAGTPTNDSTTRYFSFRTNDTENSSSSIYKGTSVFYKIYDSETALDADRTIIRNANTEYTENGYNKIVSLGYQQLKTSANNDPLVEGSTSDRNITIRLYPEGTNNAFAPCVKVGDDYLYDGADLAIPLRDNGYTFDFFHDDDNSMKTMSVNGKSYKNEEPVSSDDDVKISSSSTITVWYVNAYAVSVGLSSTFTWKYSELLELGYITIDKANK